MHDWLGPMTGAERVLDHILRCYPGADVFTAIDFLHARDRSVLHGSRVLTSFIQHLPRARTGYWSYIPLMPLAFERFDLGAYDLVISNSHAFAKGVRSSAHQTHVCYLLTPMRFAWDLEDYYLERFRVRGLRRALARSVFSHMRRWDARTSSRVDGFVAVSQFVANRCERYYGRTAPVLYPPVDTEFYSPGGPRGDNYLVASRLTPFMHLGLVVEAFRAMPFARLVVIGDGPERDRIRARCTPNISFLGYQDDATLRDHMRRARALVFPAPEDFGIVMAEAQACGTPVIALAAGGALEIVRGLDTPDPTGVFFHHATPAAITAAVEELERNADRISAEACRLNSLRFSPEHFRAGWMTHVERIVATRDRAIA